MPLTMDIYRAQAEFMPPSRKNKTVLSFKKGDGFEILEKGEGENSWWGVRRLHDNKVGWVPSQYLQYDSSQREESLPNSYQENRRYYVKRLGAMQKSRDHKLPGTSDPEPDYTDEDEDPAMKEIQQIGGMKLSKSDWQKILHRADDTLEGDSDEPDPDYEDPQKRKEYEARKNQQGLVEPQALANPCLSSRERMDIHRELLWNQKRGIDVLHRKSELKKEMERRQTKKIEKEKEADPSKKTTFEKLLDERAEKIKQKEKEQEAQKKAEGETPEFLRVHSKIKHAQQNTSH